MFKDRTGDEAGAAGGAAILPAQLAHGQIVAASEPVRLTRARSIGERYGDWRRRASDRLAAIDLVPDLAQDVGSRR